MQESQNPAAAGGGGDGRSTVDTSRPFSSVKEAVAIFGERFLVGEIYTPKPFNFPKKETPFFSPSPRVEKEPHWNYTSPSPRDSNFSHETTSLSETVKKLEIELENTKNELELLKEKGSETEVALASLNAELHKNMSKLAEAEAAAAAARAAAVRGGDAAADGGRVIVREEDKKRDGFLRMESGPSMKLAEILSIGDEEGLILGRKKEKKVMVMKKKKKPIVPLVGDLFFSRKKGTSTGLDNSVYGWNI